VVHQRLAVDGRTPTPCIAYSADRLFCGQMEDQQPRASELSERDPQRDRRALQRSGAG
jgi:hypothetical protein